MKVRKTNNRIPVVWRNQVLMPMKWRKAKRLAKEEKASFKYSKNGIRFLKLKFKPSGFDTQDIHLGIDPGSFFDGFSVVSRFTHHENIEIHHAKKFEKGKSISLVTERLKKRTDYRRIRRSRKWHRKYRFNNRTREKTSLTIRTMVNFRKHIIKDILKYYPISKVVVEDVAYNHWKDKEGHGSGFSQAEIGKTELYRFITQDLNLTLLKVKGQTTKQIRENYFKGTNLIKAKNKSSKVFSAHCIDSFSIATLGFIFSGYINLKTIHIKRVWYTRRELFRNKARRVKRGIDRSRYFRYGKNGKVKYFRKLGKINLCRIKPTGIHSNHPKKWEYLDNGRDEKFHYYKKPQRYGGTIVFGQSRSKNPIGMSKKAIWNGLYILGYKNREYEITTI